MLTILRALELPVTEALGWALVHFVWQAALLAMLLAVLLVPLRRASAQVRYLVQCAMLVVMAACPVATWWWIASTAKPNEPPAVAHVEPVAPNEPPIAPDTPTFGPMVTSQFETDEPIMVAPAPATSAVATQPLSVEMPPPEQAAPWNERVRQGITPVLPWLVGAWLLGVVALSLRLLVGWRIVQRLKRLAVTPAAEAWQLRLKVLAARLGVTRTIKLVESALIEVPTVIGWLRPVILLPVSVLTNLTPQQLEAVLAHELAHIRRHDYLVNLIQTAIETLLFYHPAVWWLSRLIRHEREHCCDDLALSLCDNTVTYVSALAAMEELRASPALTVAASGGSLLSRIRRIALGPEHVSRHSIWWGASLIALTALVALGVTTYLASHASDDPQFKSKTGSSPSTSDANEKDEDEPMAEIKPVVELDQLFTADNLPVEDVSHIKDPVQLLDQLEKGPRVSHFLMTGGGIFWQPGTAPQATYVELWDQRFAGDKELDPRVRQLIKLGDAARAKVQQRSATANPQVKSHLALVLRSTGATESIPVLIQSLHDLSKSEQLAMESPSAMSTIAVTSALWELTGRKHLFTPREWDQWWNGVKADFVVSRDRQHPEIAALVTRERVQALVAELAKQEEVARERLIALGPAAVPHLLEAIKGELKQKPVGEIAKPVAARTMSHRLAWVIDELGATSRLPGLLRRDYFRRRFSDGGTQAGLYPIDEDALSRALSHCSFADYCSIFLEADSQDIVQQHGKWPFEIYAAYCRRFSKISPPNLGGWSENEHWKKVVPAEDPSDEIAGAVPVLVAALKDDLAQKRNAACRLAAAIGFCSSAKPETLIVALRDAWLAEADEKIRPEIAFAMCRFQTPFVVKEISNGMLSDRPEIVSDCAGLMDWIPIQFNDETRAAFERLVELTRHDNDKLRNRAVRSLRGKAVKLLVPELLRLSQDKVVDIRKECAYALRGNPDPKLADILFQLADDADEQVRIDAIDSIGNLKHPESMSRLVPLLRDKRIHGSAVSALASMGGKDALPLMMDELKAGNDVGGMIYLHLRRLTEEKFEDKPELWLDWWKQQKPATKPNKDSAANSPREGLDFLKPYPKLHGLSLDMTEPRFLEIVKQQELKTRKTVESKTGEGEKVTHHIGLGDGHTLIVMFDKDSKCSGIQRVRGEETSPGELLGRMIERPSVELLRELLATAKTQLPEPVELLDDGRRGQGKKGSRVVVANNGRDRFAIVAARVRSVTEPPAFLLDEDLLTLECAFVFDWQGRLIATLGGQIRKAGGTSISIDKIDVVRLGPEEDWFVRVMNSRDNEPLIYQTEYHRIANPVIPSLRYFHYPNSNAWSYGPEERTSRFGSLYFDFPDTRDKFNPRETGSTVEGVPVNREILWDGDRNLFVGASAQRAKNKPLYQVDTGWSKEFEPLSPKRDQLVVTGGLDERQDWRHACNWAAVVPDGFEAVVTLAVPQRHGPPNVVERRIGPGLAHLTVKTDPQESEAATRVRLWISGKEETFDMPFGLGNSPEPNPIIHLLNAGESCNC